LQDPAATSGDFLGYSVAVSGTTAVVGAPQTTPRPGAAYIYVEGASGWPTTPTTTLSDPAATAVDVFGRCVAVSGTTAVVGAPGTSGNAGATYIYVKGASGWPTTPTKTLSDPEATADDGFGGSVAVSGKTAVIDGPGTSSQTGTVYIYVEGRSGWPTTPTTTLSDPTATAYDYFGWSVAVSGRTAVIGAYAGAAYIYVKSALGWPATPTATLSDPTAATDGFGYSVAVSGRTAVVGAYATSSAAGAAYIYVKGASGWPTTQTTTLSDPAATAGDRFGYSVAGSGNTAVIGAYRTSSAAGAAYIYKS
jgi:hypothetical protein